jgi:hypothetical protein
MIIAYPSGFNKSKPIPPEIIKYTGAILVLKKNKMSLIGDSSKI